MSVESEEDWLPLEGRHKQQSEVGYEGHKSYMLGTVTDRTEAEMFTCSRNKNTLRVWERNVWMEVLHVEV